MASDLRKHWDDLVAAGIPLEPPENRVGVDTRNAFGTGLTVRPGRGVYPCSISELKNSRFAYVLPVFIRCDGPGKTIVCDTWISAPWPDTNIQLLEDPREGKHPGYYEFPGDTERFPREDVLNHRIACTLSRGEIRDGVLLAVGCSPPEKYKHRDKIYINLTLVDQWDWDHRLSIQTMIYRRAKRAAPISAIRKRGPLLSRPDVIGESRSWVAPSMSVAISREDEEKMYRTFLEEYEKSKTHRG
jgi:hypothetical protein